MKLQVESLGINAARTLVLAARKFYVIDGTQRAAAFAHSAFLALFPMVLLLAELGSSMLGRADAGKSVLLYLGRYAPDGGGIRMQVFDAIAEMLQARATVGWLALLILAWAASQFFATIVQATNKAWGYRDPSWWRSPLKNLMLLGIIIAALLAGIALPLISELVRALLPDIFILPWAFSLWRFFIPWLVLFFGLAMFYKMAPHKIARFSEVWVSALCATALLNAAKNIFVFYFSNVSSFNVIYGTFGGIVALVLWIYVSGVIFIFCACLCSAQAEVFGGRAPAER